MGRRLPHAGGRLWLIAGELFAITRSPIEFSDGSVEPVGNDGFAFARVDGRTLEPWLRSAIHEVACAGCRGDAYRCEVPVAPHAMLAGG